MRSGRGPVRHALITGATRGVGRALTLALLGAGWRVTGCGVRPDGVEQLRLTVAAHLGVSATSRLVVEQCDVVDTHAVADLATSAWEQAPVDLAVANAGLFINGGQFWQADPDRWWREIEVNIRGASNIAHAFLPKMLDRGQGRVVLVSSGMGRNPSPWATAYGLSKGALAHLASSLGEELQGTGVDVFSVSPGMVQTDMTKWPPGLVEFRPDLGNLSDSDFTQPAEFVDLIRGIADGQWDEHAGRFIHAVRGLQ